MVGFIQRYNLSAPAGAGSSNFSAQVQACPFKAVLNQIHSRRPISLKKKFLRQKTRNDENCLAFQPDFQAHGTRSERRFDCGHRDSGRKGKRRGGSAGAVYDRLCGLDVVMWFTGWVQVKTRAGSWAIWSAAGVMLVGNLTPAGRRQSGALS